MNCSGIVYQARR